jgi:hypothetical protein
MYEGASQIIRDSLRITLVEASDLSNVRAWDPQPGAFSNRVSSLTNASRHFLKSIGTSDSNLSCPNTHSRCWCMGSCRSLQDSTSGGDASESSFYRLSPHTYILRYGTAFRMPELLSLHQNSALNLAWALGRPPKWLG